MNQQRIEELKRLVATAGGTGEGWDYADGLREVLAVIAEHTRAEARVKDLEAALSANADDKTGIRNGPGSGTWAVFAEKVVAERDNLRESRNTAVNEMSAACHASGQMQARAEAAEAERDHSRAGGWDHDRAEKLLADNERLREALEKCLSAFAVSTTPLPEDRAAVLEAVSNARAALKGDK